MVPVALQRFLRVHPEIQSLHLHLDNDEIGRGASAGILAGLGETYAVFDEPPRFGKDMNDALRYELTKAQGKEIQTR